MAYKYSEGDEVYVIQLPPKDKYQKYKDLLNTKVTITHVYSAKEGDPEPYQINNHDDWWSESSLSYQPFTEHNIELITKDVFLYTIDGVKILDNGNSMIILPSNEVKEL